MDALKTVLLPQQPARWHERLSTDPGCGQEPATLLSLVTLEREHNPSHRNAPTPHRHASFTVPCSSSAGVSAQPQPWGTG